MHQEELKWPPKPHGARTETNAEILRQVSRDLASICDLELTALQGYRIFRHAGVEQPSWGYCLESARVEDAVDDLILFREDARAHEEGCLKWAPLLDFYTFDEAKSFDVPYVGPSEEIVRAILELFRDIFEFALKAKWTYDNRMEFYHSIPFSDFSSMRSVRTFRRTLFSNPVFEGFDWTFPEVEDIIEE
jgi:hypothetical protein